LTATIVPRLVVFGGAMATTFATVAAWSASGDARKRLALLAVLARVVSIGGAIWLWQAGFPVDGPVRAWGYVLIGAVIVEIVAWLALLRGGSERALALATAAGTGSIVAAVI